MTPLEIREAYVQWTRRAMPALALPLALTGLMQCAAASAWWSAGPAPEGAVRYLFLAVAVAGVVVGRNVRDSETEVRPLNVGALTSLSWRLLTYALAPVAIGAILAFMTRQMWDFYSLLAVTLVGLAVLFPRYDQWLAWGRPRSEQPQ